MSSVMIFRIGLLVWAVLAAASAVWILTLNTANAIQRAALARSRIAGGIAGAAALALTIPPATAILWNWLQPWYVYIIALFFVLSLIYLDFIGSRGIAGLVIMAAYYFLYYSFACDLPLAAAGSIFSWLLTVWGIAIVGKPCWMRDQIMWLASGRTGKWIIALFLLLSSLYTVYGSIVL